MAQTTGLSVVVLMDLSDSFLVTAVKNERRSTDHVIFDEMMKIFILFVEELNVRLLRKIVEQVEQGQTGYADVCRWLVEREPRLCC